MNVDIYIAALRALIPLASLYRADLDPENVAARDHAGNRVWVRDVIEAVNVLRKAAPCQQCGGGSIAGYEPCAACLGAGCSLASIDALEKKLRVQNDAEERARVFIKPPHPSETTPEEITKAYKLPPELLRLWCLVYASAYAVELADNYQREANAPSTRAASAAADAAWEAVRRAEEVPQGQQ